MTFRQTSPTSCHLLCFSWRSAALCLAIRHRVAWLLWDQFTLELMCLDSGLISACTCVIFTEHVHTREPEIWQHPDHRERERGPQRPVVRLMCVLRVCVEDQDSRGGSQAENRTAWTSSYPRGLWGPTPVALPHVGGMRGLKSVVQAHVCLNRTQLQPVCVYVCVCVCMWERARNGEQSQMRCCPHLRVQPPACLYRVSACVRV